MKARKRQHIPCEDGRSHTWNGLPSWNERPPSRAPVDFSFLHDHLASFLPLRADTRPPSSCDTRRIRPMHPNHTPSRHFPVSFIFPFSYVSRLALTNTKPLPRRSHTHFLLSSFSPPFIFLSSPYLLTTTGTHEVAPDIELTGSVHVYKTAFLLVEGHRFQSRSFSSFPPHSYSLAYFLRSRRSLCGIAVHAISADLSHVCLSWSTSFSSRSPLPLLSSLIWTTLSNSHLPVPTTLTVSI